MEVTIATIIADVTAAVEGLGVLPYVFAGAVIGLVGRFIVAARKVGR